jgi:Protein of unknown function (DUF3040)
VPLSEDEQRILLQIEREFYESDPEFAREVSQTSLYRHAWRNIKLGLLGFVAGAVVLVASLSVHFLLAFIGFLAVFASTIFIVRNAQKLGRAGLQQVTATMRAGGMKDAMGGVSRKFRTRFRRGSKDDEA